MKLFAQKHVNMLMLSQNTLKKKLFSKTESGEIPCQ